MGPLRTNEADEPPNGIAALGGQVRRHADSIPGHARDPSGGSAGDGGQVIAVGQAGVRQKRLEPRPVDAHGGLARQKPHVLKHLGHLLGPGADPMADSKILVEPQRFNGPRTGEKPTLRSRIQNLRPERP